MGFLRWKVIVDLLNNVIWYWNDIFIVRSLAYMHSSLPCSRDFLQLQVQIGASDSSRQSQIYCVRSFHFTFCLNPLLIYLIYIFAICSSRLNLLFVKVLNSSAIYDFVGESGVLEFIYLFNFVVLIIYLNHFIVSYIGLTSITDWHDFGFATFVEICSSIFFLNRELIFEDFVSA